MPRETQTERNNNPKYYQPIQCEECGGIEGSFVSHAFAYDTICVNCLNVKLNEAAKEDEESGIHGREYDEDRAKEDRFEHLIQEREA